MGHKQALIAFHVLLWKSSGYGMYSLDCSANPAIVIAAPKTIRIGAQNPAAFA